MSFFFKKKLFFPKYICKEVYDFFSNENQSNLFSTKAVYFQEAPQVNPRQRQRLPFPTTWIYRETDLPPLTVKRGPSFVKAEHSKN